MADDESERTGSLENDYENPSAQALPLFKVSVAEAVKRGENIMFTIKAENVKDKKGQVVFRQFEDIEWLHHKLLTGNDTSGIIVPPLPVKPFSDPKSAESLSRRQLGDNTRVLKGDQFEVDCKCVEKYLDLMLNHHKFGHDANLINFLTEDEPAIRARLNVGLMTRLGSAIDKTRKGGRKDVDEYFGEQRTFANEFSKATKDASLSFNKLLVSQWRLSSSYRLVATELTTCTAERDDGIIKLNRLLKLLSEGMEDEAASLELRSGQGELTVGFYLDLFARFSDNLKEMHFQRTSALIDFESAEKSLEKAKPMKKAAAEEAFETAKKTFEESSEQARKELKSFTHLRLLNSAELLTRYAELQMKISQDFYNQLFHTRKAVFDLAL